MSDSVLRVAGTTGGKRKTFLDEQLAKPGDTATAYEADDAVERPVEGDSLKALQALAQEYLTAEREVARTAADYARAQEALADVQERRLPDLMSRHSLPSFQFVDTDTGVTTTIKYESGWRVRMPPKQDEEGNPLQDNIEKRKAICQWFRDIGLGGIVRKEVKIACGLKPDAEVVALMADIQERTGLEPGLVEDVHSSTLRAQVRRRKEKGEDVHEDIVCQPIHKATVAKR